MASQFRDSLGPPTTLSRDSMGSSLGSSTELDLPVHKCVILGNASLAEKFCSVFSQDDPEGGYSGEAVGYFQSVIEVGDQSVKIDFHIVSGSAAALLQMSAVFSEANFAIIIYDPQDPADPLRNELNKLIRSARYFCKGYIIVLGFGISSPAVEDVVSSLDGMFDERVLFMTAENTQPAALDVLANILNIYIPEDDLYEEQPMEGDFSVVPEPPVTKNYNLFAWIGLIVLVLAILYYTY
mmetsp:Transcript_6602/g.20076  ORF Transcript_6602/g.20076 Transcript_6602/m.20076 type:complete len:239 (-) Transcript_6602:43-759(-)